MARTFFRPGFQQTLSVCGLLLVLLVASGCRTNKIDWDSRVGTYTYDQAIVDLGPPDKTATLTNGRTVAEWITHRNAGGGFSVGTGIYGGSAGVSVGQTIPTSRGFRTLRLVFDEQNVLTGWARN